MASRDRERLIAAHDIIDNRHVKLAETVNRMLSSTEAARFAVKVGNTLPHLRPCQRPFDNLTGRHILAA